MSINTKRTLNELKEKFKYNRSTGKIYERDTGIERFKTNADNDYLQGEVTLDSLDGKSIKIRTNKLAWMLGKNDTIKKDHVIDHKNGNRKDNRLSNLRQVPIKENNKNKKLYKSSNTNITGVSKFRNGYKAYINVKGKQKHLGLFDTKKDALKARASAEKKYGFFKNHGSL